MHTIKIVTRDPIYKEKTRFIGVGNNGGLQRIECEVLEND